MEAVDRCVYSMCATAVIVGTAMVILSLHLRAKEPEAHLSSPKCTVVYPRGFKDHRGHDDGPTCGDIAVSWRACTPRFDI